MVKRIDALKKLEGKTLYTTDYKIENMLYARIIGSPVDHGIIHKIDFSQLNKEYIVVTEKDIFGKNAIPEPVSDQEYLVSNIAVYKGQPLAIVLHKSKNMLKNIAKQVVIEYTELEGITSPKIAMSIENMHFGKNIVIDNQAKIDEQSEWIKTEKQYFTPHQEQLYLEPQAIIADYDANKNQINILGSMQVPYSVKSSVENIMGNKINSVKVETAEGIGGAFGGKEDFPNLLAGLAAISAFKAKKPVLISFDREQDIAITTKRHPSAVKITSYTNPKTFRIEKMDIDYKLDSGAYQTISPVVLARGVLHTAGAYACPSVTINGKMYKSHTPPNGAFRGFGAPQGFFAIESHIDDIAQKLNMEPLDFRLANLFIKGSEFPSTQKVNDNGLRQCFEKLINNSQYKQKVASFAEFNKNSSIIKKGIGLSIGYHGGGYTGNGEIMLDSKVKIRVNLDKTVDVLVSNVEMGQGASTTLAQIVSNQLGYDLNKVKWVIPNTDVSPNSGPTVASRTIYIVGGLLKKLCQKIKQQHPNFEEFINTVTQTIEFEHKYEKNENIDFDEERFCGTGYKDYSYAACAVEIEFNTLTAVLKINKIYNVLDIGNVINTEIAEGQVMGGVTQALGYATTEYWYKEGIGRGKNFAEYAVPVATDIPEIFVEFINTDSELAKGLGEVPMDYPAPAVRNALANAIGIYIDELPLTPERIAKNIKEF